MNIGEFESLELEQAQDIRGGAIIGAAVGYLGGLVVGTAVGTYALYDSLKSGSSGRDAGKAMLTVVGSSVVMGITIGAVFGP